MTERKQASETLKAALVQEKELTRKALAGEKAKSESLGVISHEIRTPMNAILGFAELLLRMTELPPSCREYVRTILSSGESLLRILDDILDFSQADSGRLQIVESNFSPAEMLSDIHALFSQRAVEKGIRLSVNVGREVPKVLIGDAGRLRQILLNLTGNAVKFTEKGSVGIHLANLCDNPSAPVPKFEFRVVDTGSGIVAEKLDDIFDPFTQEDSSISRRYGGAGLGLAISRRLAHCLGGTLTVDSEVGRGSSFCLRVPLRRSEESVIDAGVYIPDVMDETFARRHPLRILIVEDDRVNLRLLQALIRKLGYEPMLAQNGSEAIELYQNHPLDCLLMDLQMPEVDGMEATRMIRTLEKEGGRKVFISALTANIFPADREECFAVGMDEYLNKPVKLISLAQVVRKACALRRATDR